MPDFAPGQLVQIGVEILAAAGVPTDAGQTVVEHLVEANLTGHDSHGIIRLPQYMATIEKGEINPRARVEVQRETAVAAVVDGCWGFGPVVMEKAVDLGLEKAAHAGIAALTVRHANHIGRLGGYVERIARQEMVGLLFVNMHGGGVIVVPWGGREARLGTNPVAAGVPRAGGEPLVLDMTTSVVAEGKVRVLRNRAEKVPEGWVVDAQGEPTDDPAAFYGPPRGGILPFGGAAGYKGYGLNVIVELLGGALSGAGCAGKSRRNGNGVLLLVVNVAHFVPLDEFHREVDDLVAFVKSSPKGAGFAEILVPGEVESRQRQQRLREGISVDEETWQQIVACGRRVGWNGGAA